MIYTYMQELKWEGGYTGSLNILSHVSLIKLEVGINKFRLDFFFVSTYFIISDFNKVSNESDFLWAFPFIFKKAA